MRRVTGEPDPVPLGGTFPARDGGPVLRAVDPRVFTLRYFTDCLACTFCHDWCCRFGVDVDAATKARIGDHAAELAPRVGIDPDAWFTPDHDAPGSWRTRVIHGACVFHQRGGRGCLLHAYALDRGIDYHRLKPIVDCLFPLTWEGELLCPADEVLDGELVCIATGPTLYRGVREELRYYFGDRLIERLDLLERVE